MTYGVETFSTKGDIWESDAIMTATRLPAAPMPSARRVRASQLRQILRDGGSLDDHLPGAPTEKSGSTSRSSALRELIGQLAND